MTDQKKEKCREVAALLLDKHKTSHRDWLLRDFTAELLKREEAHEQREEKLVECLKNLHSDCVEPFFDGYWDSYTEATTLLKELGYE